MSNLASSRTAVGTSTLNRVGFGIAGLLVVGDVAVALPQLSEDPVFPGALLVLAALSLAAMPFAWRGSRGARTTIIVTRLLAALSALPAFFAPDVPAGWVIAAASGILLALLASAFMVSGPKAAR